MFIYLVYYICLFFESWFIIIIIIIIYFNTNSLLSSFFFLHVWLSVNSLLFGYDHNELVLFHFLSNKLRFKCTLYLSWKPIEVSCKTDSRKEFAISAASVRFPISMNFWNVLFFAIRRFVFWDGLICKSQKQVSITVTNLLLIRTKRN